MYKGPIDELRKHYKRLYETLYLENLIKHQLPRQQADMAARQVIGHVLAKERAKHDARASQLWIVFSNPPKPP